MILTKHFHLEEFLQSDTATRLGIDNTPDKESIANLHELANYLEEIREEIGKPIIITSGYRSPALNQAVGGSPKSDHMEGRAVDFICPAYGTPLQVCQFIQQMHIPFKQLIHEFGRWVHLSIPGREPWTGQLLTAKRINGKTVYVNGLEKA